MPEFVRAVLRAAVAMVLAAAALPSPAAAQGRGDQVCFYEHADFAGRRLCISIGQRLADVGPGFNDTFSSATVPPGIRATMCEDINFGGRCTRLDHTVPNFQALGPWNDIVTSVAAEPIGPPGPPGPSGPPGPGYGGGPAPGYGGPGYGRREYEAPGRGPDYRGPDYRGPDYRGPPGPPRGPDYGANPPPPPPPPGGRDYRDYPPPPPGGRDYPPPPPQRGPGYGGGYPPPPGPQPGPPPGPPPGPRIGAVPPPPPPGGDQVCFYEHANFAGRSQCTPVGGVVAAVTTLNDQFSSVTVPPGVIVIACEDGNFSGRCTQFDRPNPSFDSYWNDRISSFRSQRR